MKGKKIVLFDTTCRDGNQTPGVHLSVEEKQLVSYWLDYIGVEYIEAGWPGANPTDTEFFENLPILRQAKIVAFGMTHKRGSSPLKDTAFRKVADSKAKVVCLVGKSWDEQVTGALGASLEENLEMIRNSIAYAKSLGKEVVFDAEHFFDGYKSNSSYAVECLKAAHEAGADWLVLCDTNGGTLPKEIENIVSHAVSELPKSAKFGIHCHNDCGMAVANSVAAVEAGCTMVQGTLNGLGERCGNADLIQLMGILKLKLGYDTGITESKMQMLKELSREFYELLEQQPNESQPFVGNNAFAHKGGLHTSAVKKNPRFYEHVDPALVGNERSFPISDQSGVSSLLLLLNELGVKVDDKDPSLQKLLESVKRRKRRGYTYDSAAASLAVLALRKLGRMKEAFSIKHFEAKVEGEMNGHEFMLSEATAKVTMKIDGETYSKEAKGLGPVHALDIAMRKALTHKHPELRQVELEDFKVKILSPDKATGATTHVTVVMKDKLTGERWTTLGVSKDIVGASLEALVDGYNYKLNFGDASLLAPKQPSLFRKMRLELWSSGKVSVPTAQPC